MSSKHLDELENYSIWILREARAHFKNLAMLWSIGKDSNVLLWLTRKAFFNEFPYPFIHIDTSYKHPLMIKFRDEITKKYGVKLIVGSNKQALAKGMNYKQGRMTCCSALKTQALQQVVDEHQFQALIVGIRRDEEGSRGKERVFSPRGDGFDWNYKDQPPEFWGQFNIPHDEKTHFRIHPLLHWTEKDIWKYIAQEEQVGGREGDGIPYPKDLYLSKNGSRYRSLGCVPCNASIQSNASTVAEIITELENTNVPERAGRAQDKEVSYAMQKLRKEGYM